MLQQQGRLYSILIVTEKVNVFVYGTLRLGEPFHHLLGEARLVATTQTPPEFSLVNLGEYPGMMDGGASAVTGEIFEVENSLIPILDRYEDYPELYDRRTILLSNGVRALTYILRPTQHDFPIIQSGDWKIK